MITGVLASYDIRDHPKQEEISGADTVLQQIGTGRGNIESM